MKAILSMALVLGVCGLVGAVDKVDPVGTWKCEYKIGDQMLTAELTIKKDGDKLAGAMSWPDQKDAKLKDVKLKDDTLTFSAVRKFMDKEFPLDFTLKIDGDKFKGKAATEFGGNKQEYDIKGKREKKDKQGENGSAVELRQVGRIKAQQQTGHAIMAFPGIRLISHEPAAERVC